MDVLLLKHWLCCRERENKVWCGLDAGDSTRHAQKPDLMPYPLTFGGSLATISQELGLLLQTTDTMGQRAGSRLPHERPESSSSISHPLQLCQGCSQAGARAVHRVKVLAGGGNV